MESITNSSIYIAINGNSTTIDRKTKEQIETTFKDIFENSAENISDIKVFDDVEIVYEVKTPIIKDNFLIKKFYKKMETLLEELKEFEPHFTQFERGDV